MKFARMVLAAAAVMTATASAPVSAQKLGPPGANDYNAEVTFRMFTATCMRRLGKADDIMSWARSVRLTPVNDPQALATFVGAAGTSSAQGSAKGGAWILPSPNDRKFTLSIRANTRTCAVWAEAGDPATAEYLFKKLIEDSKRPGTEIETDEDQSFTTATGKSRLLTMSVTDASGEGYQFTFMGGDKSGAFFSGAPVQLSMQLTRLEAKKK